MMNSQVTPEQKASKPPENNMLVGILADMLRSAQAWEKVYGRFVYESCVDTNPRKGDRQVDTGHD